jgi:hypothetical protein
MVYVGARRKGQGTGRDERPSWGRAVPLAGLFALSGIEGPIGRAQRHSEPRGQAWCAASSQPTPAAQASVSSASRAFSHGSLVEESSGSRLGMFPFNVHGACLGARPCRPRKRGGRAQVLRRRGARAQVLRTWNRTTPRLAGQRTEEDSLERESRAMRAVSGAERFATGAVHVPARARNGEAAALCADCRVPHFHGLLVRSAGQTPAIR